MPILPGYSYPYQFRSGPESFLAGFGLVEGEPYKSGIVLADGFTTFEMLWLGGHDGASHLLGGGFQTIEGAPTFVAPDGAAIFDLVNDCLNVAKDGGWVPLCGGGGGGGGPGNDCACKCSGINGGTWVCN